MTTADGPRRPRSLARAPALRPGDKVAVLSISSPADPAELGVGLDALRSGGTARGITLGGNLTLLAASLGTSTSWPARGGILLLEDENEEDYRLDRMLTQLRRSGYLDGVCAVVAGTFEGCGEPAAIQDILAERLADLGVPLIAWANVGHGGYFQTFPVGVAAELDADARTLHLLDPPLEPADAPAGAAASQGRSRTGSPA